MFYKIKLSYNNEESEISAINAANGNEAIEKAKNKLAKNIYNRGNNKIDTIKEIENIINKSIVVEVKEQFKRQEGNTI